MTDLAVVLQSRRRQYVVLLQQAQHAAPCFVLLGDGAQALSQGVSGPALALAIAEVVTSLLVMASVIRAWRRLVRRSGPTHHHAHGIGWIDVFLAALLATEAAAHWHETGHLRRPTILLAVTMLVLGLMHGRISSFASRRRALRITPDGLTVGGRFFTRFTAHWKDIAAIEIAPATARIVTHDGRERRFNLDDLLNSAEVRQLLQTAQATLAAARPL